MKIIYLYTAGGAQKRDIDDLPSWDPDMQTKNRHALAAVSDGMVNMFKTLAECGYVESSTILIDSSVTPGRLKLGDRSTIYVIPSMNWAKTMISVGDIVVVRGGFKSWIPLLDYIYLKRQNWILFYRANTNRHGWPFWDITLNDLISSPVCVRGRLNFNFSKPVNEDIFGKIDAPGTIPKEYDIMIGASHIHRKKGQYLTVQALQQYYRLFGSKPKAILPGGYMRCSTNSIIHSLIQSGDVDVTGPIGMTRNRLALTMNRTKLFVHPGHGGQNDRGILEAMCCGCIPLLFGKLHVSPTIWDNSIHISQDPANIAQVMHMALTNTGSMDPGSWRKSYNSINGLWEVAIPKMRKLIGFIEKNPIPDRRAACRRFVGE
jgi:hypothetical protein